MGYKQSDNYAQLPANTSPSFLQFAVSYHIAPPNGAAGELNPNRGTANLLNHIIAKLIPLFF